MVGLPLSRQAPEAVEELKGLMAKALVAVRAAGVGEEMQKKMEDAFWVVHLAAMKGRLAGKGWK